MDSQAKDGPGSPKRPGASMLRGSVLSGLGMLATMAGSLVALKLITNTPSLGPAGVGIYSMIVILGDVGLLLNSLGMRTALPKLVAAAPANERGALVRSTLGMQLLVSLLFGGVLAGLGGLAYVLFPERIGAQSQYGTLFLWVLAPLVLVSTLRETLLAVLAGLHRYGGRALGMLVHPAAFALLVGLFVFLAEGSLTVLFAVLIAAHGVAAIVLWALIPGMRVPSRDARPYRKGLRFARPLYINNILGIIFQRLDTVIMGVLLGPATAALYEVGAKKLPQYGAGLLNAALVPYLPNLSARMAQGRSGEAAALLEKTYNSFSFLGYAGALFALVVQVPVVLLISEDTYLAGLPAMGLIMVSAILALQAGIMGQTLIALDRPHVVTLANLGLAGLSLLLNFLLVPRYGILGAGYAALAAVAFSNLAQTWAVRHYGLPIRWTVYARPQLLLGGSLALSMLLGGGTGAKVSALLLFVLLSWATGLVKLAQIRESAAALRGTLR